jgi:hypothetical protein
VQPVPVTVVEGSPVKFICQSDAQQKIKECSFSMAGSVSNCETFGVLTINHKLSGESQCSLQLFSVIGNITGRVQCRLVLEDLSEQVVETNLAVLHPVEKLNIGSNSVGQSFEYKEKTQMEFTCTAEGGFPAPTLSLYIGINCQIERQKKLN